MKGVAQGLRVTQVSFILIGLVCATVIALAWTKMTFLASFIPNQNRVFQLDIDPSEAVKGHNTALQTGLEQVDSFRISSDRGYAKDVTITGKGGSEELSGRKNKSKQVETVKEYSSALKSSEDETAHISVEGSEELSGENDKSKQPEIPPDQIRNFTAMPGKKDCNYANGKWMFDDKWPLYSGHGCKQWLSAMWACRLTQRTDFDYEKLRWQPKGCAMENFTGSKFLERMRNKTLAFVGDSLGRQQFQSLMCMVTGGRQSPHVLDVAHEYGLVKAHGAIRPDGWAYRFPQTNTTILYYWSASLCDLELINDGSNNVAMHLDRPPLFLRRFLPQIHVLVLNTGHHWNRGKLKANRWVMYVGGKPNTDRRIATVAGAKDFTIRSIAKWVDSQLPSHPGLKAFLRTLAPRHFFNGEWNTGGTCDNTTPLSGGKEVLQDESSDDLAAGAVNGTGVKLLDITALSQLRDEGHISRYSIKATPGVQDCLHWCLPGVPDTWNEILFNQI